MPRATSAVARNKRKKKVLKAAKGYFGGRKNLYKTAKEIKEFHENFEWIIDGLASM